MTPDANGGRIERASDSGAISIAVAWGAIAGPISVAVTRVARAGAITIAISWGAVAGAIAIGRRVAVTPITIPVTRIAVAVGRVAIAAITTVTPVWRGQRASADRTRVAKSGNPLMEGLTTSAEV
jgi:hypothetical protein